MLRFEKQLIVISRVYCGMTCTEITHDINLSKISRENSFVPRFGIFSTSIGILILNKLWRRYLTSDEATRLTIQKKEVSL